MLYSVRMRASRKGRQKSGAGSGRSGPGVTEVHISGAEGLYRKSEISGAVDRYINRAFTHPRGVPDSIRIAVETLEQRPKLIPTLPVRTIGSPNPSVARALIRDILRRLTVSDSAIEKALQIVYDAPSMRGAALISSASGVRLEPDASRGVRASRFGATAAAARKLGRELDRLAIDTGTVREALLLASKVASCSRVVAELCVSDDPDYTTGYVASRKFGYVRIPHIKKKGSRSGGRAYFIREASDIDTIIAYLEKQPVMVSKIAPCEGIIPLHELIGQNNL